MNYFEYNFFDNYENVKCLKNDNFFSRDAVQKVVANTVKTKITSLHSL
jgi:hypothetical protein